MNLFAHTFTSTRRLFSLSCFVFPHLSLAISATNNELHMNMPPLVSPDNARATINCHARSAHHTIAQCTSSGIAHTHIARLLPARVDSKPKPRVPPMAPSGKIAPIQAAVEASIGPPASGDPAESKSGSEGEIQPTTVPWAMLQMLADG